MKVILLSAYKQISLVIAIVKIATVLQNEPCLSDKTWFYLMNSGNNIAGERGLYSYI